MIRFKKSMLVATIFTIGTFGSGIAFGVDVKVMLSGANDVPPATTSASPRRLKNCLIREEGSSD